MKLYTKEEAIRKMNTLGASGQPFVFIIDYQQEQILVEKTGEINPREILFDLNGYTNLSGECPVQKPLEWEVETQSFEEYERSFRTVLFHLQAGNSYLVNLTGATPVRTNLTLKEIFYQAVAPYKWWMNDQWVIFSPEIFIRIQQGTIATYPMKGTMDASVLDARQKLWNDPKETAEHATIVDLLRNDLSTVASDVLVRRYRYIDEVDTHRGTLLQVSSEISGTLAPDWKDELGTLLFRLLPAGSITGAPKQKTMEIIAEAETYDRGFYTGIMGYYDGENLDSAVMIRFIEKQGDQLVYKSGGGITTQSDVKKEYNEMLQKVYVPITGNPAH
ncbi:MAG: aminodeoxychorismate synthase component I [Tannerellaceae bacterium]|nr:aminodeoxychorismate synthase component I [Tannerellaceae bacterium]